MQYKLCADWLAVKILRADWLAVKICVLRLIADDDDEEKKAGN